MCVPGPDEERAVGNIPRANRIAPPPDRGRGSVNSGQNCFRTAYTFANSEMNVKFFCKPSASKKPLLVFKRPDRIDAGGPPSGHRACETRNRSQAKDHP
jgi:hypothetical protein